MVEISEKEYNELQLYKRIVIDAVAAHTAVYYLTEKAKKKVEKEAAKAKP